MAAMAAIGIILVSIMVMGAGMGLVMKLDDNAAE